MFFSISTWKKISVSLLGLYFLARLFYFLRAFASPLYYRDHWILISSLKPEANFWEQFRTLTAPHRLGVSIWIESLIAPLFSYDARADTAVGALLWLLSTVLFLWLCRRLFQKLTLSDLLIVPITCSLVHLEILTSCPFLANGPTPFFLLLLLALAWTVTSPLWKVFAVVLCTLLLSHTGYGFIILFGALPVVGMQFFSAPARSEKIWKLLLLLGHFAVAALFFMHYERSVDFSDATNPARWKFILPYIAFIFGKLIGVNGESLGSLVAALPVISLVLLSFGLLLWKLYGIGKRWNPSPPLTLALLFLSYSLTFAVLSSARAVDGVSAAFHARYGTFTLPALLGLYFILRSEAAVFSFPKWNTIYRRSIAVVLIAFVVAEVFLRTPEVKTARNFYTVKTEWTACYLEKHSLEACCNGPYFCPFPDPRWPVLVDYFQKFETNRWNILKP